MAYTQVRKRASSALGAPSDDPARGLHPKLPPLSGKGEAIPMRRRAAWRRVAWASLAVGLVTVLLLARSLVPVPAGHGTHTQLGLAPCAFLTATGLPCPGCGLTTSFAHLARFEWEAALRAHALGPVLFMGCVAGIPLALVGCVRAWRIERIGAQSRTLGAAVVLAVLMLCAWIVRIGSALFA
ncbi:MAG: DUF2752 domain-containing protein [Myxococcales bacterium]|nr:DUF2752 domain-containing protein [Myxococcales bacterium]